MRKSLIIINMVCLFLGIAPVASTVWEAAGPGESNGGIIQRFAKIGNTVFVKETGLYRSDDCGRNWHSIWPLIENFNITEINDLVTNDSCIFLNVYPNIDDLWIRSKNKGDTWEKCNIAFNEDISASGNMVFKTHTGNKVVFSNDYGDTWNTIDSCIWGQVGDYAFFNGALFACTDSGVFVSKDSGNSWVMSTSKRGGKFYPCGDSKLFLHIDGLIDGLNYIVLDGKTNEWESFPYRIRDSYSSPLSGDNGKCYITTFPGIIKLCNNEIYNLNFKSCLYNDPIILLCDSTILLGTDGAGIWRSDNDGQTWEPSSNGINEADIKSMVCYKGELYASSRNKVFKSADNGNSWNILGDGLPITGGRYHYDAINSIAFVNDTLLAGVNGYYNSEDTSTSKCYSPYSLFKYVESKNQWVSAFDSSEDAPKLNKVKNILSYKNFIMFVTSTVIDRYDTISKEWSKCNFISTQNDVVCYIKDSLFFVANTYDVRNPTGSDFYPTGDISVINLNNNKTYYEKSFTGGFVQSFTSIGDVIFANGVYDQKQPYGERFFIKSIDNGKTWIRQPIPCETPDKRPIISCLGSYKNILLAAALYGAGFCFSADTGKNWSTIPTPPLFNFINFFTYNDRYLFAASGDQGVWRLPLTELENTHIQFGVRADRYLQSYTIKNDILHLNLNLHKVEDVSISMYNLQGKLVDKMVHNKLTQGKHEIALKFKKLSSSCSIIKIKVGSDEKCLPVHYFR